MVVNKIGLARESYLRGVDSVEAVALDVVAEELHTEKSGIVVDEEHEAKEGPQLANNVHDGAHDVVHDADARCQVDEAKDKTYVEEAGGGPHRKSFICQVLEGFRVNDVRMAVLCVVHQLQHQEQQRDHAVDHVQAVAAVVTPAERPKLQAVLACVEASECQNRILECKIRNTG
jgi:hypothetical protein